MLQLASQQRLLIAVQPIDFRKGIDSLAALCKAKLDADPFSGAVFAFANRKRTAVKLLMYDGNGFWIAMKRFSKGKLAWWPSCQEKLQPVQAQALQVILTQGNPCFMEMPAPWRTHSPEALTVHAAKE